VASTGFGNGESVGVGLGEGVVAFVVDPSDEEDGDCEPAGDGGVDTGELLTTTGDC
jgi:hypothetical protein